jgi:hypothetical protein
LRWRVLAAGSLGIVAVSVAAQETPATDPVVQAPAPGEEEGAEEPGNDVTVTGQRDPRDRRVCRDSIATGSIMRRRTCRTVGEWEEIRERSLRYIEAVEADRRTRRHIQDMREK